MLAARATMVIENARLYRDAREELQRRETFIAQLGHELRNPLSAIANAVTVLDTAPARRRSRRQAARHPEAADLAIVAAGQ